MDGKTWTIILALSVFIFPAFAVAPCTDGTPYFECSTATPGFRCMPSGLTVTSGPDYANSPGLRCACPEGWAHDEIEGKCVRTSCTDAGVTKNDGQCFDGKPKYCSRGTVIEKASVCGCPEGKQATGETCTPIIGWCNTDSDCRSPTKECKENSCVNKVSCLFENPPCLPSEQCREVSGQYQCVPIETGSLAQQPAAPESDILYYAGSDSPPAPSAQGNSLPTCCAPAAALLLVGAFAFSRKE